MSEITLIKGDCLEKMTEIEDGSVDMVLADPPYGTTQCKWDSVIGLKDMWDRLLMAGKQNCVFAFTASQPFSSALVMSNPKIFKHEWVWEKNRGSNFANTVREPMKEHEQVLIFSKGGWTYNKQMEPRKGSGADRAEYNVAYRTNTENYGSFSGREENKLSDLRVPSSVQKFNTVAAKKERYHPTQKPVALMEYLIKTYANEGDTVLDFCMGSGTTGVACQNLNRKFIGIEKDPDYFETARKRITESERE